MSYSLILRIKITNVPTNEDSCFSSRDWIHEPAAGCEIRTELSGLLKIRCTMSLFAAIVLFLIVAVYSESGCFPAIGTCDANNADQMEGQTFLQTFDMSSCVVNNQIRITQITAEYYRQSLLEPNVERESINATFELNVL